MLTFLVMCVALRIYTRGFIVRNMGIEDWTMLMAAVCLSLFAEPIRVNKD
jgi:predicted CDP-diglyceride synthetase/phosphatidate cytidylyltransferase